MRFGLVAVLVDYSIRVLKMHMVIAIVELNCGVL